jgi:hypothetical protein
VPLSLSLSILCAYRANHSYAGSGTASNAVLIFRTDGLVFYIWYQSVGGSSTRCRPSFQPAQYSVLCTAFGFSHHLKKQGRKKENELEPRRVRSSFEVSQLAVLFFRDRNRLRWAFCTTTTSRTTPIRVSFGWTILGRTSRFVPLTVAVNRNRIGLEYCKIVTFGFDSTKTVVGSQSEPNSRFVAIITTCVRLRLERYRVG